MEGYDVIKTIGKGADGTVLLATEKKSSRHVAIKEITLDPNKKNRTKEAVLKEASILAQLKHPHVVSFQKSFFDPSEETLFIVQDFCDGGTLHQKIVSARENNSPFSEKQIMQWFVQMTMALQHIHSKKVLHSALTQQIRTVKVRGRIQIRCVRQKRSIKRDIELPVAIHEASDDLKPRNVFLTKKDVVKIGDFGIAKMLENTFDVAQTWCGTPCYLSPELCENVPYSSKADVWALGCLLLEMCVLQYAFNAASLISLFYKIVKVDHAEVPSQYSSSLSALVTLLLSKSPDERPSAGAILNLPFVKKHLAILIKEKEALHAKSKSRSSHKRPSSASVIKSPGENARRVRCKSAQPMNRRQQQVTVQEKKDVDQTNVADDPGEYSDDFDESDDEEYSDESDDGSNGDSPKKPVSAAKIKGNGEDEEAEVEYPDDFEDDSEEEILDDILTNARAAQDAEVEEEIVEDLDRPLSCKQKLKEQVISFIGEKMFEEVRERCARGEMDSDQRPEFEKLSGSEMMETCYLVNELFIGPEDEN